jgi:hypothetical protein
MKLDIDKQLNRLTRKGTRKSALYPFSEAKTLQEDIQVPVTLQESAHKETQSLNEAN